MHLLVIFCGESLYLFVRGVSPAPLVARPSLLSQLSIFHSAMSISPRKGKGPDIASIPAQAASTSLFSEPPVPDGQTSHRLRCFIEGAEPFTITVSVDSEICDLKLLIHERGQNRVLSGFDPMDLVLLRVRNSYAEMQRGR